MARVLLIEDDVAMLSMIAANLTARGYDVATATSGEGGLEKALSGSVPPPDLVVLNIMLPGISGWDVVRALRCHATTQGVPVVMCSALADEETKALGRRMGVAGYLAKPFGIDTLLDAVRRILGERKGDEPSEGPVG